MKPQIVLVDHYDSFTANLVDWLSVDFAVQKLFYDDLNAMRSLSACPMPLVFSPGPKQPSDIPQSKDLLQKVIGKVPVLGVCLGHQLIGSLAGGRVVPHPHPRHGDAIQILRSSVTDFLQIESKSFFAASYNSLVVEFEFATNDLDVIARDEYGTIQAIRWKFKRGYDALGVQFHPESFLTSNLKPFRESWRKSVLMFNKF